MDAGDALAKAGLVALSLTITTVLALIFSFVVGAVAAVVAALCSLTFFLLAWLALPLALQRKRTSDG